ncbi:hypothetical protein QFZ32_000433 [Streptomyces canus]|nr:hypothetical protein [Streptomyces canus]
MAVADHQISAVLVSLSGQLGYVLANFRFQRGGEHPAGAFADDLVDQVSRTGWSRHR